MRKILIFIILVGSLACSGSGQKLDLPKPSFHTFKNGTRVFILEDSNLPTFRLHLYHPAGSVFDESGKEGLAALTAQLVRTGGTAALSPQEVNEQVGKVGATIEMGAEREYAWASLKVLRDDRKALLTLMGEMFQAPRFDAGAFELARRQALVALEKIREKPISLLARHFPSLVYGSDSPWARVPTQKSLQAINVSDMHSFYKTHYHRARMILAVAGDFRSDELVRELNQVFGEKETGALPKPEWPSVSKQETTSLFFPKEVEQAALRLGHKGSQRNNPDKFALLVANFILGGSGSTTSRLGLTIRSSQGQAYSVWSHYGFGRVPGIFSMTAQTEAPQVVSVLRSMKRILSDLREQGASEQEVKDAKSAILNSLLFEYETRYKIASDEARFEFWGYPKNYLEKFVEEIRKVDQKAVNRVLKQYFHPEKLSLMVVGPAAIEQELKKEWPGMTRMTEDL